MEGLQELTSTLSNGTMPDRLPTASFKIEGSQLSPKTPIAIITGTGRATKLNLAGTFTVIHRVHPNKSPLKRLEKREHGRIQTPETVQFLGCTHYYLRNR